MFVITSLQFFLYSERKKNELSSKMNRKMLENEKEKKDVENEKEKVMNNTWEFNGPCRTFA